MSFNPYEVLGLHRSADANAIKKAFRAVSKHVHPDHGGTAAEFDLVKRAASCLLTPELREHYDKTGEVRDRDVDNATQNAWNLIASLLSGFLEGDEDPLSLDLLAAIRRALANDMANGQKIVKKHERSLARAEKMLGRFTRTGEGDNRLEQICRHRIVEVSRALVSVKRLIELRQHALDLLKDYEFRADSPMSCVVMFGGINNGSASTFR